MAVSTSYLEFVLEQLASIRDLWTKRMFGGVGVYSEGQFFAVLDNDTLFFKVDDETRARYVAKRMPPFAPIPGAKPMMGYYQVPPDVLESGADLATWAKEAVAVSRRAGAKPKRRTVRNASSRRARTP